jgi:Zn-dependent peptidase ImmA (M78 family)
MDRSVSAVAIGKYESGSMQPSPPVLASLARALRRPLDFFLAHQQIEVADIEFRKVKSLGDKQALARATIVDYLDRCLALEDLLGLESPCWNPPRLTDIAPDAIEASAIALRKQWQLGLDPLDNLIEIAEQHGVKIAMVELPQGVFGCQCLASVKRGQARKHVATIVLNSAHQSGARQRFTLAHELAHLYLDANTLDEKQLEKAADRWAAAFLMPRASLLGITGEHRNAMSLPELIDIKAMFRVSVPALITRLSQLEVLPKKQIGYFWAIATNNGWKDGSSPEPRALPVYGVNQRLQRLALRALAENLITESRAAELLQMTRFQLEALLDSDSQ